MAPNIRVVGGKFNHIKGNLKEIDCSSHEINIDSNNMYNNELIDSYNSSKRFNGQNPRSRLPQHDEESDAMDWDPTSADAGPPPPQPHDFMQPQISSADGPRPSHVINHNSFNMYGNHIRDSHNDRSRTYYNGRAPPTNQQGCRSNSRSFESASVQIPFQVTTPQHRWTDPQLMRQTFLPAMKQSQSSLEENHVPTHTPGYNDENYDSDDADSSSHSTEERECMSTRMADMSIQESPMPSPTTPKDRYYSQVTTHHSQPTFKSDPRKPTEPQVNPMGSSNPSYVNPYNNSNFHPSYPYPPVAPHIKELAAAHFHAHPSAGHQDEIQRNNDLNNLPPMPTSGISSPPSSSSGPIYRTINGDLTKYNLSKHQQNFNSYNMEGNKIVGSFNNTSLVDYSRNRKQRSNQARVSGGT